MRRFCVYKRPSGIYYAELFDPDTGARIASLSTKKRHRDEAVVMAHDWAENGLPSSSGKRQSIVQRAEIDEILRLIRASQLEASAAMRIVRELRSQGLIDLDAREYKGPGMEPFGTWLQDFWKFDTSSYIADRIAHGQRATRRHCQDMEGRAREIESIVGSALLLRDVKRSHLTDLGLQLKAKGLAAGTINKTMSAATTALRWAAANEFIPTDPTKGLRGFTGAQRKRGILEPAEVKALFSVPWEDERARVACLVAATTGARVGEILALQHQDIGQDRLFIRHSFSNRDGLKTPKNGEPRVVPLIPKVRSALLRLEAASNHPAGDERYIFAGRYPDRPLDANRILHGMRMALVSMNGVRWDEEEKRQAVLDDYARRGIDFHSWRHWYAKTMSDRLEARTVQRATGHKTAAMLEHYAEHLFSDEFNRLGLATGEAYSFFIQ
jgi:integrase